VWGNKDEPEVDPDSITPPVAGRKRIEGLRRHLYVATCVTQPRENSHAEYKRRAITANKTLT
jgi:hypothetical protein